MHKQEIKEYLESLIGKTLNNVNLACQMMMFVFEDTSVHAQCFTRILLNGQILLTTSDYQNWDGVAETNNDEWYNLSQYKNIIVNNKVTEVTLTETNDVFIWLENGIHIQVFISNSSPHYGEDCEQWRIFDNVTKSSHIVVNTLSIERY